MNNRPKMNSLDQKEAIEISNSIHDLYDKRSEMHRNDPEDDRAIDNIQNQIDSLEDRLSELYCQNNHVDNGVEPCFDYDDPNY